MKKKPKRNKRNRLREKTDGLLDVAMQQHEAGTFSAAQRTYQQLLELNPDNSQALFLLGVVKGQLGEPRQAIELLQKTLAIEPDHLQAISELAKLFQETGQLQASVDMLRKLILLKPELGGLYNNLGIVLRRLNRLEEALDACQKAVDLSPDSAVTYLNLGNVAKGLRRFDEAAVAYQTAIALNPGLTDAYRPLVSILRENGKRDELAGVLKQWQNVEPDNPIPQHILAVYSGKGTPTRASDDYVRQVFNEFAATFDEDLSELDYQGPRLISESLVAKPGEHSEGLDVLDAGCGTGLCGSLLRPLARRLVGVDLSDLMIHRAKELHVYDELVVTELTGFLIEHPHEFDLIVAADTFNYFGDLEPLLAAVVRSLRDAGILIYTLEKCDSSESVTDYQLNPHGRYSHNRDYVKDCMEKCALNIHSMKDAILRKERNQNVNGIVVRCSKEVHHREEAME